MNDLGDILKIEMMNDGRVNRERGTLFHSSQHVEALSCQQSINYFFEFTLNKGQFSVEISKY